MDRQVEFADKLARVRHWLAQSHACAVHIAGNGAFAWITCGGDNCVSLSAEVGAAAVLVTQDHAYVFAANNELRRIVDEETPGATPGTVSRATRHAPARTARTSG
jgi:hypothetical protein